MVKKLSIRGRERRWLPASQLRLIPRGDGMPGIEGYAAPFNQKSADIGFREIVMPGAFDRTLANNADVRGLIDHNPPMVLGRTKSGTLVLKTDDYGLHISVRQLPDTSYARDLVVKMERGDVDGMSFAFDTRVDKWRTEDGEEIRELHDIELFDVSVVTYPAYPQTEVALRSLQAYVESRQVSPDAFRVTPFADLPIVRDDLWNPNEDTDADIIAEVNEGGENWDAMKDANLAFAPGDERGGNPPTQANAYKLKVARRIDGTLTVFFRQLASRIAILNGARGGVDVSTTVRQAAFNHAMRYYDKLEIPEEDRPDFNPRFKGQAMKENRGENLGAALTEAVEAMVSDDVTHADVVGRLAEAAGVEMETVSRILNGSTRCPPVERVSIFAEVLGVSVSSLTDAALQDGCDPTLYSAVRSKACPSCRADGGEKRGAGLSSLIEGLIEDMITEDLARDDIIERLGRAAGIAPDTVNQIVLGTIDCPPARRLTGFARVLDVSARRLADAAIADGCDEDLYAGIRSQSPKGGSSDPLAMKRRRLELEERTMGSL